ncbi:MAG: diacylglycerol kinase family protein [Anaerolineae bacterium]
MKRPYKGNLLQSFRNALIGLAYVTREERNARIHLVTAVLVIAVSAWLRIGLIEWALMIAAIALVFAGEMLNTVVELTVDLITLEHNPLAKQAKDVAAGAILVAAIAAVVMGMIVLGPHLWEKLAALW